MTSGNPGPSGGGAISVGDDTPTGEPENGPAGPYITDKDDGSRQRKTSDDTGRRKDSTQKSRPA
jgi:hypothetical protein